MTRQEAQEILYTALGERIGLLLRTNDPERAKGLLQWAKASSQDPALAKLQFRLSPIPDGNLVICKVQRASPSKTQPEDSELVQ